MRKTTIQSQRDYDDLHKDGGFADELENYQLLATLLRGKRALDIGCGSAYIERFAPEIVGIDFSYEALKIAKQNGAKYLCQADAENLPFKDNSFELSLNFGVLEHIIDQPKAVSEIARVSQNQIFIVHAKLPYGLEKIRLLLLRIFKLHDQPVEIPLSMKELKKMVNNSGLRVIFEGLWNYIDPRWICKCIAYGLIKWPSHHLLITTKSKHSERQFTGDNNLRNKFCYEDRNID